MKKNFKIIALAFVAGTLIFGVQSCEKKPSVTTPGKEAAAPSAPDLTDTRLPIDTVAPDTVERQPAEVPRVLTKETSDLLEYMDTCADAPKYAQGILRRMAYDSPEYTRKLLNTTYSHFIIVDKQAMQLALFDRFGREELRYGIACGKNYGTKARKGDCRTSEGFFSAEGIYDSTDWLYTDDNGRTSKKKGQFGPRFVRLLIPETRAIGIHGTCAPGSIGRRTSHGCIRVKNENILELVKHVTIGMPVIVSPSDKDMAVNSQEGPYVAQVTINPSSRRNKLADIEEKKHEDRMRRAEDEKKKEEENMNPVQLSGNETEQTAIPAVPGISPESPETLNTGTLE